MPFARLMFPILALVHSTPVRPVDNFRCTDLKTWRGAAVHEYHQVLAVVSSARDEQSIKLHEVRGGRQRLAGTILKTGIARRLNAERIESGQVSKAQRTLSRRRNSVNFVRDAAWPNRFESKPEADLRKCTVTFEARVEDLNRSARAPAPWRCRTADRIAAGASNPPNVYGKRNGFGTFERVEERSIVHSGRVHDLAVRPFVQPFDHAEHLICTPRVNEVDRTLAVEQAMLCVQPEASLLRIIQFREPVDDIPQIRN